MVELLKKNIHMMHEKNRAVSQVMLDEDSNVPDSQPDVERIIQHNGVVKVEEVQVATDKVLITGQLTVAVLYIADTPEHPIHRLDIRVPFQESQSLQGAAPGENVQLRWETEDVSVSMINSRKLNLKAVLMFTSFMEEIYDAQAAVELHGMPEVSVQTRTLELLQAAVQKRDVLRIRDEITVPSNKPNIARILWESIQLRGTDIRVLDQELDVKGELFVFALYEGDDEAATKQWLETALPFHGTVPCAGCTADMISQIGVSLGESSLEVREDYDGERRLVSLEAVLDLDIRLYTEEQVEVLEDVYSPVKELIPIREEQVYESLLMKNFSKVRAGERIRLKGSQPRMLQTCSGRGEVKIDEAVITDQGISVEGAVLVSVLYVSSDDKTPYAVLEGAVPIAQVIEMNGMNRDCRFTLQTSLEQLSVTMIDSEEVEVKVSVNLNAFAVQVHREPCIIEIEERELDLKKLQELPGIVGYVVQPRDSLWSISKQYYTTPERICSLNHLDEKDVRPGTKLIILKTVNGN